MTLLLAVTKPKLNEIKDSITIKQTIEALHDFDSTLKGTLLAPGNKRVLNFKLSRGRLSIDAQEDKIQWILKNSRLKYSEPDIPILEGDVIVETKGGKRGPWEVILTLDYENLADIRINSEDTEKTLTESTTPHKISITNLGGDPQQVDIVA